MTTTTTEADFPTVLKERRGDLPKAEMARRLSVEWMTYDMWEKGAWIPGDEHAELIAEVIDWPLPDVVWMLYRARAKRAKGVYLSSDSRLAA